MWNLDITISKFILPRLKRFKEIDETRPVNMSIKQWKKTLDKIILLFEISSSTDIKTLEDVKNLKKGMKFFAKYFRNLWW